MSADARSIRRRPTLRRAIAAGLLGAVAVASLGAGRAAGPEPSPFPKRWELSLEVGPLRTAAIRTETGVGTYLYMTYKVTNRSGTDLLFAPTFDLALGDGRILRSGRDVPLRATQALLHLLENPLLEDQISIVDTLLQGPENAKQGLVVWPLDTVRPEQLVVYFAGFSGETATIEVPDVSGNGSPSRRVLRKTLSARYRVPGELDVSSSDPLVMVESRWVMR